MHNQPARWTKTVMYLNKRAESVWSHHSALYRLHSYEYNGVEQIIVSYRRPTHSWVFMFSDDHGFDSALMRLRLML